MPAARARARLPAQRSHPGWATDPPIIFRRGLFRRLVSKKPNPISIAKPAERSKMPSLAARAHGEASNVYTRCTLRHGTQLSVRLTIA